MELLKHLFHFDHMSRHSTNVDETIDNILERLEEIIYNYKGKKQYGDIRMACSNFYDNYPERVFLELYYQAPNDSTKVMQFSFYPWTGIFEISGRRTRFGERKPFVKTYDENKAYRIIEQRIKEIPFEMKTILKECKNLCN